MGVFIFNACPKCDGPMRFNIDRDLDCFRCGKVVYLVGGFNDSRTGEGRSTQITKPRSDVDKHSEDVVGDIRGRRTPNNSQAMARQRTALFRRAR